MHAAGLVEVIQDIQNALGPAPETPLCEAIRCGDDDAVFTSSSKLSGLSTLLPKEEAIAAQRPDYLRLLLKADSLIEDRMVAKACDRMDRESIRILLEFGWPINQPVNGAASLLCTRVDNVEFTKWLLDNGADVNARSKLDESALSFAIAYGSMAVVRLLIAQGTDVMHGNLLHCAARRQNQEEGAELVTELVRKGANVNAHEFDDPVALQLRALYKQPTPLHVACEKSNMPVAQALLQLGADPYRKMLEAGKAIAPTPLDIALSVENRSLVILLNKKSQL